MLMWPDVVHFWNNSKPECLLSENVINHVDDEGFVVISGYAFGSFALGLKYWPAFTCWYFFWEQSKQHSKPGPASDMWFLAPLPGLSYDKLVYQWPFLPLTFPPKVNLLMLKNSAHPYVSPLIFVGFASHLSLEANT